MLLAVKLEVSMSRKLGRSLIAIIVAVVMSSGALLAPSSASAAPRVDYSKCKTVNHFTSCLLESGGTVSGKGTASGICALYPAYEQLSGPNGTFQTPHHSNWCGSPALQLGQNEVPGTWFASLWEGPTPAGKFIELVVVQHTF